MIGAMIASTALAALGKKIQANYNSPQRQMARLAKAGLPSVQAYMAGLGDEMQEAPFQNLDFSTMAELNLQKSEAKMAKIGVKAAQTKSDLLKAESDLLDTPLPGGTRLTYDQKGNPQVTANYKTNRHRQYFKGIDQLTSQTELNRQTIQNLSKTEDKIEAEIRKINQDTSTSKMMEITASLNADLAKHNIKIAGIKAGAQEELTAEEIKQAKEITAKVTAEADNAQLQGAALKSLLAPYETAPGKYEIPWYIASALFIADKKL